MQCFFMSFAVLLLASNVFVSLSDNLLQPIAAFQFNIIVGTMLVVDTIVLGAWMEFDPMQQVVTVDSMYDKLPYSIKPSFRCA